MSVSFGPKIPQIYVGAALGDNYLTPGNSMLRSLQALLEPTVISIGLNTPPTFPTNGASYIIGTTPTGLWSGRANQLVYWSTDNPNAPSGEWEYYIPIKGWTVGNTTDGKLYIYSGTAWVLVSAGAAVTSVFTAGLATGGPITATGTVTVAGSGNTVVAATANGNLAAAVNGDLLTADGSGNVKDSGVLLTSLQNNTTVVAAHSFLGGPTSSTAAPTFRALVATDIPTLAYGSLSGTPVLAVSFTAVANKFLTAYDSTTGLFTSVQPSFSNISGVATAAQYVAMVGDSGSGGTQGAVPAPPSGSAAAAMYLRADGTWAVPTGSGTGLSSIGLSTAATWLTVSNSPLIANGVLAIDPTTGLAANKFIGTPNGSTGAVALRSLVVADLPTSIPNANLANSSLTVNGDGTVLVTIGPTISLGATGALALKTQNANTVLAGNPVSGVATPAFRALVVADLPPFAQGLTGSLQYNAGSGVLAGSSAIVTSTGKIAIPSGIPFVWNSDTGFSRDAAGIIDLGNGAQGSKTGTLNLTILNALTGIQVNSLAPSGNVLRGNGTNFISAVLAFSDLSGSFAFGQIPAGGSSTTFLCGNGSWATPAGTGVTSLDGTASGGVETIVSGSVSTITTTGSIRGSAVFLTLTGNQTLSEAHRGHFLLSVDSSTDTYTLPATLANGWYTHLKNGSATSPIILTPTGGTLIDGAASISLQSRTCIYLEYDGTSYHTGYIAPAANNAANLVFASPDGTSGLPSMRALTQNDMPHIQIVGEDLTGQITGSTSTFTLANTPVVGSVALYKDGQRLRVGALNDYTISGLTITMATAPAITSTMLADYWK